MGATLTPAALAGPTPGGGRGGPPLTAADVAAAAAAVHAALGGDTTVTPAEVVSMEWLLVTRCRLLQGELPW